MMEMTTLIGLVAATSTTFAFVPQVWTILKTRNTQGISLSMYSVFTSGVFLWLMYGLMVGDAPIVIANAITFSLALTVLTLTIRYQRLEKRRNKVVPFALSDEPVSDAFQQQAA